MHHEGYYEDGQDVPFGRHATIVAMVLGACRAPTPARVAREPVCMFACTRTRARAHTHKHTQTHSRTHAHARTRACPPAHRRRVPGQRHLGAQHRVHLWPDGRHGQRTAVVHPARRYLHPPAGPQPRAPGRWQVPGHARPRQVSHAPCPCACVCVCVRVRACVVVCMCERASALQGGCVLVAAGGWRRPAGAGDTRSQATCGCGWVRVHSGCQNLSV
jgi:hypothetical protein